MAKGQRAVTLQALQLHVESRGDAATSIHASAARKTPDTIALAYTLRGDIDRIVLPPVAPPERGEELWKSTCFEAFIAPSLRYYELNFAPSARWAVYGFDSRRQGMRDVTPATIAIDVERKAGLFELRAEVQLPELASQAGCRVGLTAVVEQTDGALSYWALSHTSLRRPDFHHPHTFSLEL